MVKRPIPPNADARSPWPLALGLILLALAATVCPKDAVGAAEEPAAASTFADYQYQAREDKALIDAVLKQGFELLKGTAPTALKPNSAWGPYNYKGVRQPFGWSADSYTINNGPLKYFLLTDIRQDVARSFNRAVLGRDAVLGWLGVGRVAEIQAYGLFTADWGNAIVLPVAWLEEQKRRQDKRDAVEAGKTDMVGVSRDSNELANYGLYWLDRFVAAGIITSKVDLKPIPNGLELLMRYNFDTQQVNSGRHIWWLQQQRETCSHLTESFARMDCLKEVSDAFTDFGQKVMASNHLLIASEPNYYASHKGTWNVATKGIEFKNVSFRSAACGHPHLVCEPFAKYGVGEEQLYTPDNLVCFRVAGGLPKDLRFSMSEEEARRISKAEADAGRLNMASLLLRIDQAPVLKPTAQKCPDSNNHIVAEGRASVEARLIWSGRALESFQRP